VRSDVEVEVEVDVADGLTARIARVSSSLSSSRMPMGRGGNNTTNSTITNTNSTPGKNAAAAIVALSPIVKKQLTKSSRQLIKNSTSGATANPAVVAVNKTEGERRNVEQNVEELKGLISRVAEDFSSKISYLQREITSYSEDQLASARLYSDSRRGLLLREWEGTILKLNSTVNKRIFSLKMLEGDLERSLRESLLLNEVSK
jgi:hypothetical protein